MRSLDFLERKFTRNILPVDERGLEDRWIWKGGVEMCCFVLAHSFAWLAHKPSIFYHKCRPKWANNTLFCPFVGIGTLAISCSTNPISNGHGLSASRQIHISLLSPQFKPASFCCFSEHSLALFSFPSSLINRVDSHGHPAGVKPLSRHGVREALFTSLEGFSGLRTSFALLSAPLSHEPNACAYPNHSVTFSLRAEVYYSEATISFYASQKISCH